MAVQARAIRSRIKTTINTQKITKAMQMVAAAKVRRAQERVAMARPYTERIRDVFRRVAAEIDPGEFQSPLLVARPVKRVAIVVVTSDKGLCGSYNASVIRHAVNRQRHYAAQGAEVKLILVGTKGVNFFRHSRFPIHTRYTGLPQVPTYAEAGAIVADIVKLYTDQEVDLVELVYTNFQSLMRYVPTEVTLLPARPPEGEGRSKEPHPLYEFEPSAQEVMDRVIPKYLETVTYHAMLESAASELAARMTAMSAASKNAKEMILALNLVYNKARQASITQEILEVVGGANALQG